MTDEEIERIAQRLCELLNEKYLLHCPVVVSQLAHDIVNEPLPFPGTDAISTHPVSSYYVTSTPTITTTNEKKEVSDGD